MRERERARERGPKRERERDSYTNDDAGHNAASATSNEAVRYLWATYVMTDDPSLNVCCLERFVNNTWH